MIADVAGLGSYLAQASFSGLFRLRGFNNGSRGFGVWDFGVSGSGFRHLGSMGLRAETFHDYACRASRFRGLRCLGFGVQSLPSYTPRKGSSS